MIHIVITAVISAMMWPFGWHQEALALAAAFYFGREHAQAEYRAIKSLYSGKRANAPWWCGFEPSSWDLKSITDFSVPLLIAITSFFI